MEWSNNHKFNSFNSMKGLSYYEHYKQIVAWMNEESNYLPPPIECNLDPVAECNLRCYFCITQRYLRHKREEVGEMRLLPTGYMTKLVTFLAKWGVRGLCISGGGEPALHNDTWFVILQAVQKGMDVAFVTNATAITDILANALMQCRWVALSVDAANPQTYKAVKGRDLFFEAIKNIEYLTSLRANSKSKVDLCFKYLVLPENYTTIYDACLLAKGAGVQDFHVRPVDFERWDIKGAKKLGFDMKELEKQFAKCHELADDKFHVYTVTHKYNRELHVKHDFKQCLATPLVLPILQDGNAYLCVDRKMEAEYRLGSCYPEPEQILEWWGSDEHRELVKSVNIGSCSRCTWSQYNRQIEEAVIEDRMCLSFP